MHKRKDKLEPLGSKMLETVCTTSLTIAKGILERRIEAERGAVDLHLAAILRMCRGPASSSEGRATVGPHRTATEAVDDVLFLDMMMFRTAAFIHIGGLKEEFDSLMAMGATAVFDRALTNRGYPRDASYWDEGTLTSGSAELPDEWS